MLSFAIYATGFEPTDASAAGSPNISLDKSGDSGVLFGQNSNFTLSASNPSGQPTGYNLSFRDVLPAGISYVAGSAPAIVLLRGVHNHQTIYTLNVKNNFINPSNTLRVEDYLPAGLEFLGCGEVDNTSDAPTNPGSSQEYKGSGPVNPGNEPGGNWRDDCVQPDVTETVENPAGELLPDPDGARRWLIGSGLIKPGSKVSVEEYGQLLEVRSAIRLMMESNLSGELERAAIETLKQLAGKHPAAFEVTDQGGVRIDLSPVGSVGELIAQMLAIIARSIDLNEWQRLKICASDDCRWAFYDTSKNRGGTWCRMEVCGNRNKNRRYRSKTATDHKS